MQQFDEAASRSATRRLRCVQQITDADEETLQIVSVVLERARPAVNPERKKRGRPARVEAEKGGGA